MPERADQQPRVGVGAVILDATRRVLLVLRRRAPEADHWGLPGGKVDWMETAEDAIVREINEELGVDIELDGLLMVGNYLLRAENQHWVAPVFQTHLVHGTPSVQEPDALADVKWFALDNLPTPLTVATQQIIPYLERRS